MLDTPILDFSLNAEQIIDAPWHYSNYFRSLNYSLQLEIEKRMKELKDSNDKYTVSIRLDCESNKINSKLLYVIHIKKECAEDYNNNGSMLSSFVFCLHSKLPSFRNCPLQELLQDFYKQLEHFTEKLMLAEELFDRYNLHINEDMEGIDIEVRINNGRTEYKLTKTPMYDYIMKFNEDEAKYNHITANNQKDGLVRFITGGWMTLEEIITAISLVYE